MTTEDRQYFDSLTERVLNAIFEVSNTLGAGFLEKVYERALLKELSLRDIPGHLPGFISRYVQGRVRGRILRRYPSRRQAGSRAEMRRTPDGPTFRPMPELPARLWQKPLPRSQFSEAKGGMEAGSPRFPALGFTLPVIRFHSERSDLTRSHVPAPET